MLTVCFFITRVYKENSLFEDFRSTETYLYAITCFV